MRILHTSDWHAGRVWKGQDRLPELQDILEHLGDFVEREKIDLVLMTGDVFESASPPPEAERAVTRFFKRIGKRVPSVSSRAITIVLRDWRHGVSSRNWSACTSSDCRGRQPRAACLTFLLTVRSRALRPCHSRPWGGLLKP